MSLAIPSPQSVYRGNYASLPAATLKPPVEGNRTIPVSISWASAGLSPNYCIEFNARHQQTLAINQIAAIHVDNSKCSSSMHIAFLDTQFEILIGPNAVGFYPVVTNTLEFFAWIDLNPGPQDVTILQVLNFLPPPILFGTQLGGTGVGTVREVDTAAPITGGPITDQGTIGLSTPLAINFGGTGGATGNAALDNLSSSSGAVTGSLVRSGTGIWSVTAAGSGTITGVTPGNGLQGGGASGTVSLALSVPVSVANGGTGATAGNAALDSLSAQSGANAGVLQRSSGGNWSTLLPLPLALGSGGTGASGAAAALTNLGAAPLNSPVFTGTPNLPTGTVGVTQTAGTANTTLATTAFTQALVNNYLPLAGGTLTGGLSGTTITTTGNITGGAAVTGTNITASGNLTANGAIFVGSPQALIEPIGMRYSGITGGTNVIGFMWSSPNIGVYVDNNWVGNVAPTPSDPRLKTHIAAVEVDSLGVINEIALHQFDITHPGPEPATRHFSVGFMSDQLASLVPEAVFPGDGEKTFDSLDLLPLVAHLVGAVQQLTNRLEALEGKA